MDLGAALSFPLVLVGEQLGLFTALAAGEPMTAGELAEQTHTDERYVQEWFSAMAAGGYATFDSGRQRFPLEPEQALVLAGEDGPAYIPGAFHVVASVVRDLPHVTHVVRSGEGLGWHEHDDAALPRHGAVLPARVCRAPGLRVDSGARRRSGEARARCESGRHRVRSRGVDRSDGSVLPELKLQRLRLPRPLDRAQERTALECQCAAEPPGGHRGKNSRRSVHDFPSSTKPIVSRVASRRSSASSPSARRSAQAALRKLPRAHVSRTSGHMAAATSERGSAPGRNAR